MVLDSGLWEDGMDTCTSPTWYRSGRRNMFKFSGSLSLACAYLWGKEMSKREKKQWMIVLVWQA